MSKKYIDRNKVLTSVCFYCEKQFPDGSPCQSKCFEYINMMQIPAADVVEVRHGRWKLYEDGSGTCQECGYLQKHVWDMDGWQNYCGHCGADMRNGGQDE